MLKVAPWKGVMRFGKRGKLNPRYIRPFQIIERIGPKCLSDDTLAIPLEEIQLDDKLNFVEEPVEVMGTCVATATVGSCPRWSVTTVETMGLVAATTTIAAKWVVKITATPSVRPLYTSCLTIKLGIMQV
ncbi:hypothetical protein Tco_0104823 [Tanacetum coccineum]